MRTLLLWVLLAITLGALVGMLAGADPGYVLISYDGRAVETSLWAAIVLLVLAYLAVRVVIWLFTRLLAGRVQLASWSGSRRRNLANKRTREGVVALAEGDHRSAGRLLVDSAERSDQPLVNFLGAAEAAQALGDFAGRDALLDQALASTPGSASAVAVRRGELQLAAGQAEQALSTALELRRSNPKLTAVLSLLKRCYLAVGDFAALGDLLPALRKASVVDEKEERALQGRIALARLAESPTAETWKALPKGVKTDPDVVLEYAGRLQSDGLTDVASNLVATALSAQWDPRLIDLYGVLGVEDASAQSVQAERWLKERPNDDRLLLALGRIALKQHEWSRAREYLEASVRQRRDPEVAGELGRLCLSMGEEGRASEYLAQAADLPKLPQPTP